MLEGVSLSCIRGTRRLFNDVSFVANTGDLVELRGANGSGKTSLLRILCGLSKPDTGEVRWQGKDIRSLGEDYFSEIAYLGHQNGVKDELSAIENLRISSGIRGSGISKAEAAATLERAGLTSQRNLPARSLSAGQRRRLAMARVLVSHATVWLLDEVLTSLDDAAVALSRELIDQHLEKGGLAIVATHQELNVSARRIKRIDLSA